MRARPSPAAASARRTQLSSRCALKDLTSSHVIAGGLGTRIAALTEPLASQGYPMHLFFVDDPAKPGIETRMDGKLHLVRWGQWISRHHPQGVYAGEEEKRADYSASVPAYVVQAIAAPAIA